VMKGPIGEDRWAPSRFQAPAPPMRRPVAKENLLYAAH